MERAFLMKKILKSMLNHNPVLGSLIGWFYQYLSFLSPFPLLVNDKYIVALSHPTPSYRDHILILPKKRIKTFYDLTDFCFLDHILTSVRRLCENRFPGIEKSLLVNGGIRQEIMQLHFHLIDREENRIGNDKKSVKIEYDDDALANVKNLMKEEMKLQKGFTLVFDLNRGNEMTIYFV